MDKYTSIRNCSLRLPPGFRFHPTDEELVVEYLKKKVLSHPLPASIIPELDVCKADPWELPGNCEKERYFFSRKEQKYPNRNRSIRATSSGFWKATGLNKQVMAYKTNQPVGMKKTLVFYRGKPPRRCRTDWIMHEYRLDSEGDKGNWVLCRIFLKRRSHKRDLVEGGTPVFYDFMSAEESSASSGVTDASSNEGDEGVSCFSSFNPVL